MNKDLHYITAYKLEPGDRIVVPKSEFNLVQHHTVYLGYDDFGNHYISENVVGVGVKLTQVHIFFENNLNITRIEKYHGTNYERKELVKKALSKLGLPYSYINYNCEHFVNEVVHGRKESPQVNIALAVALIAGVGLLVSVLTQKK